MSAAASAWLIVGLGNPGTKYARTRHNAGASLLDFLKTQWDFPAFKPNKRARALVTRKPLDAARPPLVLAFPQSFMNDSGSAVAALLRTHHIPPNRLLALHDDKDLLFGTVKLQRNRSAAGHKGVQSIMDALGTQDFWRLRIGVGVEKQTEPTEVFVLQPFTRAEQAVLRTDIFPRALALLDQKFEQ